MTCFLPGIGQSFQTLGQQVSAFGSLQGGSVPALGLDESVAALVPRFQLLKPIITALG